MMAGGGDVVKMVAHETRTRRIAGANHTNSESIGWENRQFVVAQFIERLRLIVTF